MGLIRFGGFLFCSLTFLELKINCKDMIIVFLILCHYIFGYETMQFLSLVLKHMQVKGLVLKRMQVIGLVLQSR